MQKYKPREVEIKWQNFWAREKVYSYDPASPPGFVVDTPPPTVSGHLHIGHVFSYTQTDIIVRFQRMSGKNVFYPMGWDDNGLPTEKRVQNFCKIVCDPDLPYDEQFQLSKSRSDYQRVSRKNFIEVCSRQTLEDERKYEALWRNLALSVDWSQTYTTIGERVQKTSQHSFLDLFQKGFVENRLEPVLWDTQFQTAVAQADIEDREQKGFYHDISFSVDGGGEFVISTTRPELLPACIAVAANPKDKRYKKWFSKKAVTPLFGVKVPILPSDHVDPEKGTGIMMVCTFGDMEDVSFWKKHKLPLKEVISRQGLLQPVDWSAVSEDEAEAQHIYKHLIGLRVRRAREKIVEILKEKNFLVGEPKPAIQFVKFYEKGDDPLELISERQWFVKILDHKEALLKQGGKIKWHPESAKKKI